MTAKLQLALGQLSVPLALLLLVVSGTCSAVASVLLKTVRGDAQAVALFGSYGFAIAAYGLGFVLYAVALKRLPLTLAYPVMIAVTMVEVYLYGVIAGERIEPAGALGALLIMLGAALVLR